MKADRFWPRVDKQGPVPEHRPELGPCWLWTGPVNRVLGYGITTINYVKHYAHRLAWEVQKGPIPPDTLVCHHCDNRLCVNADHLFLGTIADNINDMHAKGRNVKGEAAPWSKLSAKDVGEIRKLYAAGGITHKQLAERFGVTRPNITKILNNSRWRQT